MSIQPQNLSLALVEKDVIAGHVVPGTMLFTQPALSTEMKTATYENRNGIKVTAVVEPGNPQEESERGKGVRMMIIFSNLCLPFK